MAGPGDPPDYKAARAKMLSVLKSRDLLDEDITDDGFATGLAKDENRHDLYNLLKEEKLYSKSYEDFTTKYAHDLLNPETKKKKNEDFPEPEISGGGLEPGLQAPLSEQPMSYTQKAAQDPTAVSSEAFEDINALAKKDPQNYLKEYHDPVVQKRLKDGKLLPGDVNWDYAFQQAGTPQVMQKPKKLLEKIDELEKQKQSEITIAKKRLKNGSISPDLYKSIGNGIVSKYDKAKQQVQEKIEEYNSRNLGDKNPATYGLNMTEIAKDLEMLDPKVEKTEKSEKLDLAYQMLEQKGKKGELFENDPMYGMMDPNIPMGKQVETIQDKELAKSQIVQRELEQADMTKFTEEDWINYNKKSESLGRKGVNWGHIDETLDEMGLTGKERAEMRTRLADKWKVEQQMKEINIKVRQEANKMGLKTPEQLAKAFQSRHREISQAYQDKVSSQLSSMEENAKLMDSEYEKEITAYTDKATEELDKYKTELEEGLKAGKYASFDEVKKLFDQRKELMQKGQDDMYNAYVKRRTKHQSDARSELEKMELMRTALLADVDKLKKEYNISLDEEGKAGFTKEYMEQYQAVYQSVVDEADYKDKIKREVEWNKMGLAGKVTTSVTKGVLNLAESLGVGAKYFSPGFDAPDILIDMGEEYRKAAPEKQFDKKTIWQNLTDFDWHVATMGEQLPMMLPGLYVGGKVFGATSNFLSKYGGLSTRTREIIAAGVGGAASRQVEAPMEAFGVFQQKLKEGASFDEAYQSGINVWKNSQAMMLFDAGNMYMTFAKAPRVVTTSKGDKFKSIRSALSAGKAGALDMVVGGVEEVAQEYINEIEFNPMLNFVDFAFSDQGARIFATGAVMEGHSFVWGGGLLDRDQMSRVNDQMREFLAGMDEDNVNIEAMEKRSQDLLYSLETLRARGDLSEAEYQKGVDTINETVGNFKKSYNGELPFGWKDNRLKQYTAWTKEAENLRAEADKLPSGKKAEKEALIAKAEALEGEIKNIFNNPESHSYSINGVPMTKSEFESIVMDPDNLTQLEGQKVETDDIAMLNKLVATNGSFMDQREKIVEEARQYVDEVGEGLGVDHAIETTQKEIDTHKERAEVMKKAGNGRKTKEAVDKMRKAQRRMIGLKNLKAEQAKTVEETVGNKKADRLSRAEKAMGKSEDVTADDVVNAKAKVESENKGLSNQIFDMEAAIIEDVNNGTLEVPPSGKKPENDAQKAYVQRKGEVLQKKIQIKENVKTIQGLDLMAKEQGIAPEAIERSTQQREAVQKEIDKLSGWATAGLEAASNKKEFQPDGRKLSAREILENPELRDKYMQQLDEAIDRNEPGPYENESDKYKAYKEEKAELEKVIKAIDDQGAAPSPVEQKVNEDVVQEVEQTEEVEQPDIAEEIEEKQEAEAEQMEEMESEQQPDVEETTEPEVDDMELSPEMQQEYDEDWEENFGERAAEIAEQRAKLSQELKDTAKAKKNLDKRKQLIDDIANLDKELADMEQAHIDKWEEKVKAETKTQPKKEAPTKKKPAKDEAKTFKTKKKQKKKQSTKPRGTTNQQYSTRNIEISDADLDDMSQRIGMDEHASSVSAPYVVQPAGLPRGEVEAYIKENKGVPKRHKILKKFQRAFAVVFKGMTMPAKVVWAKSRRKNMIGSINKGNLLVKMFDGAVIPDLVHELGHYLDLGLGISNDPNLDQELSQFWAQGGASSPPGTSAQAVAAQDWMNQNHPNEDLDTVATEVDNQIELEEVELQRLETLQTQAKKKVDKAEGKYQKALEKYSKNPTPTNQRTVNQTKQALDQAKSDLAATTDAVKDSKEKVKNLKQIQKGFDDLKEINDAAIESLAEKGNDNPTPQEVQDEISELQTEYRRAEGLAEFIVAWVKNPVRAEAMAPTLYQKFKDAIMSQPDGDKRWKMLEEVSYETRILYNLNANELFHVTQREGSFEQSQKPFLERQMQTLQDFMGALGIRNINGEPSMSFWDRIQAFFSNDKVAMKTSMKKLFKLNGLDYDQIAKTQPDADFYMLTRLMAGRNDKARNMLEENGLVAVKFDPDTGTMGYGELTDPVTGEAMTIGWLLAPLSDNPNFPNSSVKDRAKQIKNDKDLATELMTAQRTVELYMRKVEENDGEPIDVNTPLSGIGGGIRPDIEVAQEIIENYDNDVEDATKERVEKFIRRYREFADRVMQYARDLGMISQETYDTIKANNQWYVSLKRVFDNEMGDLDNPFLMDKSIAAGIGDAAGPLYKKAEGSDKDRGDALENLIATFYSTINRADNNFINGQFLKLLRPETYGAGAVPLSKFGVKLDTKPQDMKDVMTFWNNGEAEYWKLNPELSFAFASIRDMSSHNSVSYQIAVLGANFLDKTIGKAIRIIQNTITMFPIFSRVVNPIRDRTGQLVVSRTEGLPFSNMGSKAYDFATKQNLNILGKKLGLTPEVMQTMGIDPPDYFLTDEQALKLFELYGGGQSGYDVYLKDDKHYHAALYHAMNKMAKEGKHWIPSADWIRNYTDWLSKGELRTRLIEFKSAYRHFKQQGLDDYAAAKKAAFEARDLCDFAVKGHIMQSVKHVIPFANASIQGTKRTIKFFGEMMKGINEFQQSVRDPNKPIRPPTELIRFAMFAALPSILMNQMAAAYGYEEEYTNLPDWQRDLFWNFKLFPGGVDIFGQQMSGFVSIPKPFELGVAGSFFDRAIEYGKGREDAFDGYVGQLAKSTLPVDPTNILGFAGGLKGVFEVAANWDSFRKKHVVSVYEEQRVLGERNGKKYASNLGKMLGGMTGSDPRNADHLIKSYFGYFGNHAMKLSNLMGRDVEVEGEGVSYKGWNMAGIMQELKLFRESKPRYLKSVQAVVDNANEHGLIHDKDVKSLLKKLSDFPNALDKDKATKTIIEFANDVLPRFKQGKRLYKQFLDGELGTMKFKSGSETYPIDYKKVYEKWKAMPEKTDKQKTRKTARRNKIKRQLFSGRIIEN